MATVTPTINRSLDPDDGTIIKVTWNGLNAENNVGAAVQFPSHADRCVEFRGTWNSATAAFEGGNGGTLFYTLTNPAGSALTFTANGVKQIVEGPAYIRPNITNNAAGNVTVDCDLILRRAKPLTR